MIWKQWIRQSHRWLSMAFTVAVIANIVVMAAGQGEMPPPWVTYSPLPPLALMWFTGLYLFVLPYASKSKTRRGEWRGGRRSEM